MDMAGSASARAVLVQRSADGTADGIAEGAAVVVQWPVSGVPAGWQAAQRLDSVGAVTAAGIALVAPWVRSALPPTLSDSVRAIAWWSDGVPAAIERTRGTLCAREVALAVPEGSDVLLSPAADGLLRALRSPCGGPDVLAPRDDSSSALPRLGGAALSAYVRASRFRDAGATSRATQPVWLATALLALAMAALLAEHVVRRQSVATPTATAARVAAS